MQRHVRAYQRVAAFPIYLDTALVHPGATRARSLQTGIVPELGLARAGIMASGTGGAPRPRAHQVSASSEGVQTGGRGGGGELRGSDSSA